MRLIPLYLPKYLVPLAVALVGSSCALKIITPPVVPGSVPATPVVLSSATTTLAVGNDLTFTTQGGKAPFQFSLDSGPGSIDPLTGVFARAWQPGSTAVRVTDSLGSSSMTTLTLPPGAIQWGAGVGRALSVAKIITDAAGNFYFLCTTAAPVSNAHQYNSSGTSDMMIAKLSSEGTVRWITEMGAGSGTSTRSADFLYDANGSGQLYFVGTTSGVLGGRQLGTHGVQDLFVGSLDSNGNLTWVTQQGASSTNNSTYAQEIRQDSSRRLLVMGSSDGNLGGIQIGSQTIGDVVLAQFDTTGLELWVTQNGGHYMAYRYFMLDLSGNPYLLGYVQNGAIGGATIYGNGGVPDSVGYKQLVTLKFSSNSGALLWGNLYVAPSDGGNIEPDSYLMDSAGNLTIVGFSDSSADLGGTQYGPGGGFFEVFAMRFAPNGIRTWLSEFRGTASDGLSQAVGAQDTTGNIYIASSGAASAALGTQVGVHSNSDTLLLKLTATGALTWSKQLGGGGTSYTLPGNVYLNANETAIVLSGFSWGDSHLPGPQYGTHSTVGDVFLSQFDLSGNLLWVNQLGGGGTTQTSGQITLDPSGDILTSGQTSGSLGGSQVGSHGLQDRYLARYSSAGSLKWVSQVGGGPGTNTSDPYSYDTVGLGLIINSHGFFIWGNTEGDLGGTKLGPHGTSDAFLTKLNGQGQLQ